jgi:hypothetical protein
MPSITCGSNQISAIKWIQPGTNIEYAIRELTDYEIFPVSGQKNRTRIRFRQIKPGVTYVDQYAYLLNGTGETKVVDFPADKLPYSSYPAPYPYLMAKGVLVGFSSSSNYLWHYPSTYTPLYQTPAVSPEKILQCANPGWSVVQRYPGSPANSTIQIVSIDSQDVNPRDFHYFISGGGGSTLSDNGAGDLRYSEVPLLGFHALIAWKNGAICGYTSFGGVVPSITSVCLDKSSYSARIDFCSAVSQECPPNTCSVDCGTYVCCYGSDGISVFNYNK